MKFIYALVACFGAFSLVNCTPLASADAAVVARVESAAGPVGEHGLHAKETAVAPRAAAQSSIPPGIHVFASQTHELSATAGASNPFHIGVNVGQQLGITVIAHASFFQVVTFSGLPTTNGTVTFSGSGEGVPMQASTGGTSLLVQPQGDGFLLSVLFQFSPSGPGGPPQTAVINQLPVPIVIGNDIQIQVTSEDGADNDNNDSVATITITTAS